jgi:hypothetical protein
MTLAESEVVWIEASTIEELSAGIEERQASDEPSLKLPTDTKYCDALAIDHGLTVVGEGAEVSDESSEEEEAMDQPIADVAENWRFELGGSLTAVEVGEAFGKLTGLFRPREPVGDGCLIACGPLRGKVMHQVAEAMQRVSGRGARCLGMMNGTSLSTDKVKHDEDKFEYAETTEQFATGAAAATDGRALVSMLAFRDRANERLGELSELKAEQLARYRAAIEAKREELSAQHQLLVRDAQDAVEETKSIAAAVDAEVAAKAGAVAQADAAAKAEVAAEADAAAKSELAALKAALAALKARQKRLAVMVKTMAAQEGSIDEAFSDLNDELDRSEKHAKVVGRWYSRRCVWECDASNKALLSERLHLEGPLSAAGEAVMMCAKKFYMAEGGLQRVHLNLDDVTEVRFAESPAEHRARLERAKEQRAKSEAFRRVTAAGGGSQLVERPPSGRRLPVGAAVDAACSRVLAGFAGWDLAEMDDREQGRDEQVENRLERARRRLLRFVIARNGGRAVTTGVVLGLEPLAELMVANRGSAADIVSRFKESLACV